MFARERLLMLKSDVLLSPMFMMKHFRYLLRQSFGFLFRSTSVAAVNGPKAFSSGKVIKFYLYNAA